MKNNQIRAAKMVKNWKTNKQFLIFLLEEMIKQNRILAFCEQTRTLCDDTDIDGSVVQNGKALQIWIHGNC